MKWDRRSLDMATAGGQSLGGLGRGGQHPRSSQKCSSFYLYWLFPWICSNRTIPLPYLSFSSCPLPLAQSQPDKGQTGDREWQPVGGQKVTYPEAEITDEDDEGRQGQPHGQLPRLLDVYSRLDTDEDGYVQDGDDDIDHHPVEESQSEEIDLKYYLFIIIIYIIWPFNNYKLYIWWPLSLSVLDKGGKQRPGCGCPLSFYKGTAHNWAQKSLQKMTKKQLSIWEQIQNQLTNIIGRLTRWNLISIAVKITELWLKMKTNREKNKGRIKIIGIVHWRTKRIAVTWKRGSLSGLGEISPLESTSSAYGELENKQLLIWKGVSSIHWGDHTDWQLWILFQLLVHGRDNSYRPAVRQTNFLDKMRPERCRTWGIWRKVWWKYSTGYPPRKDEYIDGRMAYWRVHDAWNGRILRYRSRSGQRTAVLSLGMPIFNGTEGNNYFIYCTFKATKRLRSCGSIPFLGYHVDKYYVYGKTKEG